jgi:hypothetical protein
MALAMLLPALVWGSQLPRSLGSPDSCRALSVSFTLVSSGRDGEAEQGTVSLGAGGEWRVECEQPVRQVTVSRHGLTTFVYPDERRAIRLWTPALEAPAWVSFAAQALYSAEDMAAQGFEIVGFEQRGDTAVTSMRWPGKPVAGEAAVLRVFHVPGLIVRLDVLRADRITRQLIVEGSALLGRLKLPANVRFLEPEIADGSERHVHYSNYRTLAQPGELFNQTIPAGYKVDERRW